MSLTCVIEKQSAWSNWNLCVSSLRPPSMALHSTHSNSQYSHWMQKTHLLTPSSGWLWTAVSMYINTHYYLGGLTVHTSSSSPSPRGWRWGHHQQFIRQERNYTPDRHRHCIRCGSLVLLLSRGPGQGAMKIRYMSGNDDNFITRSCITLHWWRWSVYESLCPNPNPAGSR